MAALTAAIIATLLAVPGPQQQPPRDPRPRPAAPAMVAPDTPAAEAALTAKIAESPTTLALYTELARLQAGRGAYPEAEATLIRARQAAPANKEAVEALASFYNRIGDFEKTMTALEAASQLDPGNPQSHLVVATFYLEKVAKDTSRDPAQQLAYIRAGVAATDRALAVHADHADAVGTKALLLTQRAALETDPMTQQQLVAEADALIRRAVTLSDAVGRTAGAQRLGAQTPPGAAGVPGAARVPGATAPVRVGGNIPPPKKLRDVKPIYPPEAQSAGIQGVVILEVTIAADGRVSDARVLRSIPPLDDAALAAVRGWEFTPTLLNGVPVPVIMTVTVNFTLP